MFGTGWLKKQGKKIYKTAKNNAGDIAKVAIAGGGAALSGGLTAAAPLAAAAGAKVINRALSKGEKASEKIIDLTGANGQDIGIGYDDSTRHYIRAPEDAKQTRVAVETTDADSAGSWSWLQANAKGVGAVASIVVLIAAIVRMGR